MLTDALANYLTHLRGIHGNITLGQVRDLAATITFENEMEVAEVVEPDDPEWFDRKDFWNEVELFVAEWGEHTTIDRCFEDASS
jgi:hypothetical protein